LNTPAWQRAVEAALCPNEVVDWRAAGGSQWGAAWTLRVGTVEAFVKTASGFHAGVLAAEADGLRALAATRTVRVPEILVVGEEDATAFLALERLELRRRGGGAALGRALAALHRAPAPGGAAGDRYGWSRDNWIGGTPQANGWRDDWCAFFLDRRLAPQLALAAGNGYDGELQRDGERLLAVLPTLLHGHDPAPSLLHGDLWSGNAATLADGTPAVFDPAVYVGDREADLAMSQLFGGFDGDFYRAYADAWPLAGGYRMRRELYNLYHVLNHLNLFGGGYLAQARRMIASLLAEAT
jgi:fructosamine-3-kinase